MKVKFWTKEETDRMLDLVKRSDITKKEAMEIFSKESGRTVGCILQKYYLVQGKRKYKPANIKVNEIQLPQGFEFNFVPKRAVMQKDSVTLYF